jgi:hypothetical protein
VSDSDLFYFLFLSLTTETSQIDSLSDSLHAVCREVEQATNFHAFTLVGGPSLDGGGALMVLRVQNGHSLNKHKYGDLKSYLGDLYPILKEKWCQWLATTCSECAVSPMTPFSPSYSI